MSAIPSHTLKGSPQWAELPIIDFSYAGTYIGLQELLPSVRDAMHNDGIMYVVNHGYAPAQNQRIFEIADVPFTQVSQGEKMRHLANPREHGFWWGYKMRQFYYVDNGVYDQYEHYSAHHMVDMQQHPLALSPYLQEMGAFNQFNHHNILYPILRLLALGLEMPEEMFVNIHSFDGEHGKTWLRFQKYFPYLTEDEPKVNDVWLKGHTDSTSISIHWSQPVPGLQIKSHEGDWRWVRHIDNAIIVNIGDAMEMLSGGFYKAPVHRVVQPPPSQRADPRLCVFYFVNADDSVKLVPFSESPVLQRVGITRKCADQDAPTMAQWQKARLVTYGTVQLPKDADGDEDEEVMKGVHATVYN